MASADGTSHPKLQGKHNYFEWRRYFDRAAKTQDLWELLIQESNLLTDPDPSNFLVYKSVLTGEIHRDPTKGGTVDASPSLINWQAALKKYEKQQSKVKELRKLIQDSVSSSIQIELEDQDLINNPLAASVFLVKTYGVSNERARSQLKDEANSLKLESFSSASDFLNRHRELKFDLIRAGMAIYDDSSMITNTLSGLPPT